MDRRDWLALVHDVTKSQLQLKQFSTNMNMVFLGKDPCALENNVFGVWWCSINVTKIKLVGLPWWLSSKNLPANAEDTGSIPDLERSHILQNSMFSSKPLCHNY